MKKLSILFALLIVGVNSSNSARKFSNFEIATWYLNADLVVVCTVENSDTVLFDQVEKLLSDTSKETYNIVQEKYDVVVHSVLNDVVLEKPFESVYTPEYISDYSKKVFFKPELKMRTENGGYIYKSRGYSTSREDYHEHYRLRNGEKFIVILNKVGDKYQTIFQTPYTEEYLDLFHKINKKGDSYFDYLRRNASKRKYQNLFPDYQTL